MLSLDSMNTTRKQVITSAFLAVPGLMLFAVGLYITIQVNLGAAPWDVFLIGMTDKLGILYGTGSVLLNIILILIDIFVLKEHIGIGTLIDAVVVGKTVDLLNYFNLLPTMSGNVLIRVLLMIVAFFFEGFGQYLYMKLGIGYGPKDTLQIGLSRRITRISVGAVNIIILAVVLIIGILLGGPFGVGSLIAPFAVGITQQIAFNVMKFDPKSVENQDLITSVMLLLKQQ